MFWNTGQIKVAPLKRWDCFLQAKWRPIWRPKPEVNISQLLDKIATPFQRLTPPIFVFQKVNGATMNTAQYNRKLDIEDGGR